MNRRSLAVAFLTGTVAFAFAAPAVAAASTAEKVSDEVFVVRDDAGNWGGGSMGMTHQRGPGYQAKKVLDCSDVPEAFWRAATQVRLSAYFCVRDYSPHDAPATNGLDETLEIVVNGRPHPVPTKAGLPVYVDGKPLGSVFAWHDFALPKQELVRGPNEIVFRMAAPQGKKPDDYLYLGIDNTVPGGRSWVRFSAGAKWQQDRLTAPGGKGEYMVRLYLIRGGRSFRATWRAKDGRTDDPAGAIVYAGSHGPTTRVEWDPTALDRLEPVTVVLEGEAGKPLAFRWLDGAGKPAGPVQKGAGPRFEAVLPAPLALVPSGIEMDKSMPPAAVTLRASRDYHPRMPRVDMAPHMTPPKGAPIPRKASCRISSREAAPVNSQGRKPLEGGHSGTGSPEGATVGAPTPAVAQRITLANDNLACRFEVRDGRLRLASIRNEYAAAEMARRPDDCRLFVVEVDGRRYAGSRDFACRSVVAMKGRQGFTATLVCQSIALEGVLSVWIDDALRMGLVVTNRTEKPLGFKVAFPHLAGLAVSDRPADDYYFYPYGGGIISDAPALIRAGYGDHEVLYQVMDLFSPKRGAGLAVWCTDTDGRYKGLALRKHVPGKQEVGADVARPPTAPEFTWTNSLEQVPGIGLAYEYLRRTRKPGESFAPKDVALWAHPGDWHAAMRRYADWCHQAWKYRPYPSRLTPVENMIAVGWGKSPIFGKGKYRTDFVHTGCDCLELMSWWEWSALGPKAIPLDELEAKLGKAKAEQWQSYLVADPVTGKPMFSNNPGDYDGYNRRWGGLAALRKAIDTYHGMGTLVTLYTDPLRVDYATKCGREHGEAWGVVKPDGTYRDDYDAWRMCLDVDGYRRWVAAAMGRALRETGADGIRLDEYGHRGSACFSKRHPHTFAEWGCTEWQREVAESTRLVRAAMDEVDPKSVLTTEHPGYDFLMPCMEGCITYDLTVLASPRRPLECNTQRFYFPECKAFELDHRGADRQHRKRFWNAVGSFGAYYPEGMYRVLRENGDAFAGRRCRPLVPTLAKCVYANEFRADDSGPGGVSKTIYTLYNATGHTFYGPALRLDLHHAEHVFDLLRCREADYLVTKGEADVKLFLARDDVACLVRLPTRLSVTRSGGILDVSAKDAPAGWRVAACDAAGRVLLETPLAGTGVRLDVGKLPTGARAECVKLLDGTRLTDVAAVPGEE